MEDDSLSIFKEKIPREWVVRKYQPDYGIDLAIEVFDKIKGKKGLYETLGEHFFIQLKSCNKPKYRTINVVSRMNVELGPLQKIEEEGTEQLEVIKYALETNELLTVQHMGAGEIVLLVLVDMGSKRVFFVCLNDYIDKIILPEDPLYANKKSKTIYIPVVNELDRSHERLLPVRFIAKRAKFYAAFEKFQYQNYYIKKNIELLNTQLRQILETFIAKIKILDIWHGTEMWAIIAKYYQDILTLEKIIKSKNIGNDQLKHIAEDLWHGLSALSWTYEEMCREWFLPTRLSMLCSTKNETTLAKNPILPVKAGCVSYRYLKTRKRRKKR